MPRLTRWILAHKRLVALLWLIVAIVSLASISSASSALTQSFALPGQPGYEANRILLQTYGNGGANPPAVPVITLPAGTTVDSPGVRAQLGAALAGVGRAVPHLRIASYASTGDRLFVSADGRTTFALITCRRAPSPVTPCRRRTPWCGPSPRPVSPAHRSTSPAWTCCRPAAAAAAAATPHLWRRCSAASARCWC